MTRWIRVYYDEDDVWSYFELDDEERALRQVDLQGPHHRPVTAASLSEVLRIRDQGDLPAMAAYERKHGILAEGGLEGWREAEHADEIAADVFERLWVSARESMHLTAESSGTEEAC